MCRPSRTRSFQKVRPGYGRRYPPRIAARTWTFVCRCCGIVNGGSIVVFLFFFVLEDLPILLMLFLLLKVSGVTLLEKDITDRRPDYAAYQAKTSSFLPWPPSKSCGDNSTGPE